MAAYSYSAINAEGLQLTGEVHAPDLDTAREQLRIRGLLAEFMEELPASGDDGVRTVFKKIKPKTLQIFSRQFATMIEAGLNVVSSLVILEEQTDDPYFALVIKELRADVEGGLLLSQAMAATRRSSAGSTSRWSKPARRPASSTRCSTASRSRSRRRRRSSAA
jgi:type IV pilus assembly protein PilC